MCRPDQDLNLRPLAHRADFLSVELQGLPGTKIATIVNDRSWIVLSLLPGKQTVITELYNWSTAI